MTIVHALFDTIFEDEVFFMISKNLEQAAITAMTALRDEVHESVGLAILLEQEAQGKVIASVKGDKGFYFHFEEGMTFNLFSTAPGKILLAHLEANKRHELISRIDFQHFNERTLASAAELESELIKIRAQGYALDLAEEFAGCHCVSCAIMDNKNQVIAAIWLSGHSHSFNEQHLKHAADRLALAAAEITTNFSGTSQLQKQQYIENIIIKAQKIISGRFCEELDIEKLAAELNVGYSWFRRSFKRVTGESPRQYQISQRIEKACFLLNNSSKSILKISQQLGYDNQDYFSRIFKKKTGLSPLAYQKNGHRE
ncbi:MAG: helix-turn-helix domain-containing protein [Lentisphaeraceae bacterium]|nr:helix-turn-helix domain-containing protein [Lentisphaeraceae bacterium]